MDTKGRTSTTNENMDDELTNAKLDLEDSRDERKRAEKKLDDAARWLKRCELEEAQAIIRLNELENPRA